MGNDENIARFRKLTASNQNEYNKLKEKYDQVRAEFGRNHIDAINAKEELDKAKKSLEDSKKTALKFGYDHDAQLRKEQLAKGAKIAGAGIIAGGAAVAGAGAWAGNKAARGTRKFVDDVKELSNFNEGTGLTLFFIASILIHLFDSLTPAGNTFLRPGWALYAYTMLFIFAFFFLFDMKLSREEIPLISVIMLAYLFPYLMSFFSKTSISNSPIMMALSGMLFFFPILPLYIGLKFSDNTLVGKITKWYIIIWVIALMFYLINTFVADKGSVSKGGNMKPSIAFAWDWFTTSFSKAGTNVRNTVSKAIAFGTGQPYQGQEESRVGIYVEKVKPLESRYTTQSNAVVEAHIRSYDVKEPVNISTYCKIDGVKSGIMSPSYLPNVEGDYENIVNCEFGLLPEGVYTATVTALFEFESSSDIEYTFVDSSVKSDQYQSLGINTVTIATYTGGPVELGLPSLSQPLRISTSLSNTDVGSYPFGVSLRNKWTQGQVVRGKKYILNVPSEIELVDCYRDYSQKNPLTNGRTEYAFEIDETQIEMQTFDAVTCRMKYRSAAEVLEGNLKNTKTFAARARYEYKIEATTNLVVEKG
jgi:hypothetical protein